MSNYTPIVAYGPKDSLTHGDPNKALKGVQVDAELAAIASAISTKVDSPMVSITAQGQPNVPAATFIGIGSPGTNDGVQINGGVTSADYALSVRNWNGATTYLLVRGDGRILANGYDFTPATGTFTGTLGVAASGSANFIYYKVGPLVTIVANSTITGNTGGSGTLINITSTGLPAAIQSVSGVQNIPMIVPFIGNGGRGTVSNSTGFSFGFNSSPGNNQSFQWLAGMIIFQYILGF